MVHLSKEVKNNPVSVKTRGIGSTLRIAVVLESVLLGIANTVQDLLAVAVLISSVVPMLNSLVLLLNVGEGDITRGARGLGVRPSLLVIGGLIIGGVLETSFIEASQNLLPCVGSKPCIEGLLLIRRQTTGPFHELIELLLRAEYLDGSLGLLLSPCPECTDHSINQFRSKALGDQSLLGSWRKVTSVSEELGLK